MTAVVAQFFHNGEFETLAMVLEDLRPDDRAVAEEIIHNLYPNERAPFGAITDKVHDPADAPLSCREVFEKYGVTDAYYSVNGAPMQPFMY